MLRLQSGRGGYLLGRHRRSGQNVQNGIPIGAHMHACTYLRAYMYTNVHTCNRHTYIHTWAHKHTHTHTHTDIHTYIHVLLLTEMNENAEYTRAARQGRRTENARHMHAAPADVPAGRLSWKSPFLFLLGGPMRRPLLCAPSAIKTGSRVCICVWCASLRDPVKAYESRVNPC